MAQRLTARHTGFQRELHQVGIPPAENALARELGEDVDQLVTAIDRASALAVDREYLSATITLHVAAVELLDESMIFQAERDALGAVLQNMHSEMELNLQEAERLRMRVW